MSLISSSRRNLVSGTIVVVSGAIVVAAIVAALAGVPPASTQKRRLSDSTLPPPNFPIGTATGTQLTPPCGSNDVSGTCWGLNISGCPNPPTMPYDATAKVTSPTGASIGTIIFLSGETGMAFYDEEFTYGSSIINTVVGAGYTAVQIKYDNTIAGWLTGPATDNNGPISLACLPSTSLQWVHDNFLGSGTPLCATGNSGGSQQIAYALSQYGLGGGSSTPSIFTMVEATSGPELSRIDYGCAPADKYTACAVCGFGTHQESYGTTVAETGIDPAYTGVVEPNGPCYKAVDGNGTAEWAQRFYDDSTLSEKYPPILTFTTDVHFAFGGQDAHSPAIPEGLDWASLIPSATAIVCVPQAEHAFPSSSQGAAQIETDLTNYCKLP